MAQLVQNRQPQIFVYTCIYLVVNVCITYFLVLLFAPFERVMLILQAQQFSSQNFLDNQYTGGLNAFSRIINEQGFLSLWRASMAIFVHRYLTQRGASALSGKFHVLFSNYRFKTITEKYVPWVASNSVLVELLIFLVLYPLYLARTHLALDMGVDSARQYTGLWNCISTIYNSGGASSLYYGFAAAAIQVIINNWLFKNSLDLIKQRLENSKDQVGFFKWQAIQLVLNMESLLTYPLMTTSYALALQAGRSDSLCTGTLDCACMIYNNGGMCAFYSEYALTFVFIFFGSLIFVKDFKVTIKQKQD